MNFADHQQIDEGLQMAIISAIIQVWKGTLSLTL
jgi:hypothetical protein